MSIFPEAKLVFVNNYDEPLYVKLEGWKRTKYKKVFGIPVAAGYSQEKPRLVQPEEMVSWSPDIKSRITYNRLHIYKDVNKDPYHTIELRRHENGDVVSPGEIRTMYFEDAGLFLDHVKKGEKTTSNVFRIGIGLLRMAREKAINVFHNAFAPIRRILREKKGTPVYDIIHDSPFAKKDATIRQGGSVACDDEKSAFAARQDRVKAAQAEFLDYTFLPEEKPLVAALVGSGGGQRARLCTIGFGIAAEETGLLDCATYFSTLSGSTWFLAPWLLMGGTIRDMKQRAIEDAKKNLGLKRIRKDLDDIVNALGAKFACGQPINPIDVYGALLGAYYLHGYGVGGNPQRTYFSDVAARVQKGDTVIPILTAVTAEIARGHDWCFFTPWEFGSRWFGKSGAYIPIWSFGRKFKDKKTRNWGTVQDPIYGCRSTLPFILAICGSAPAATTKQAYQQVIGNMVTGPLKAVLRYGMTKTDLSQIRVMWAEVYNPMRGLTGFAKYAPFKYLKLADAGVKMGCPIFDTYRRPAENNIKDGSAPDVIIIFDSSAVVGDYVDKASLDNPEYEKDKLGKSELEMQVKYAQKRRLPFPKVDYTKVGKEVISIFTENPDPKTFKDYEIPMVIYMPRITSEQLIDAIIERVTKYPAARYLGELAQDLKGFSIQDCMKGACSTFNFKHIEKMGGKLTSEQLVNLAEFNLRVSTESIKKAMKKRLMLNRKRDGIMAPIEHVFEQRMVG